MSAWAADGVVANHNGNGFPHVTGDPNAAVAGGAMIDPAALMANPGAGATANQFNPTQFANPQQVMAMQNGPMRNASPSFGSNPVYQTNSVIPSKRPRPREDSLSLAGSPTQNPGMLPTSRAETPQQQQAQQQPPPQGAQQQPQAQQFQNFQQGAAITQPGSGQPSPYPHLQPNGSANATPSPIMANQMRPGSVPQRVSTASPHPFSPAAQNFAPQASPIPSEHGGTPQPNPYIQAQAGAGGQFPPGFNPNFTPTPSPRPPSSSAMPGQMVPQNMAQMPPQMMGQMAQMNQMNAMNQMAAGGQMPPHMMPQHMQQAMQQQMAAAGRNPQEQSRMMYQMHLQRQMQQGNMQMSPQMAGQNMSMSPQQAQQQQQQAAQQQQQQRAMMSRPPMPNGQMHPGTPMKPQPQQPSPAQRQMANPDAFMKQLSVFMSSKQLPLETNPMIGDRPVSLVMLFQAMTKFGGYRNVCQQPTGWANISGALGWHPAQFPQVPGQLKGIYDRNLVRFEEWWTQNRMKQQQQQQQAMAAAQGTPSGKAPTQGQATPGPAGQMGQQPTMPPAHAQSPVKQMPGTPQATVNGFQPASVQPQPNATPGHARNSLSRSVHHTPTQEDFTMSPSDKPGSMSMRGGSDGQHVAVTKMIGDPLAEDDDNDEYHPYARALRDEKNRRNTYTGFTLESINGAYEGVVLNANELDRVKPSIPFVGEMGNIDVAALTRSLQCGMHGEVRLALDSLSVMSGSAPGSEYTPLDLNRCGDLVESLIECAEDQIDALAENTEEVSDEILLAPYEEVARACRTEQLSLREVSVIGTQEHDLDRAADRLICITGILRNLSFYEHNRAVLGDEAVIKFLCMVIRYLGTRNMVLRTHENTLDFMKDVVVLLSNAAGTVEIPGRDQALSLVHFLLCFAPSPAPTTHDDRLFFTPNNPALQPYMPNAVDALAKLLARDVPNRTHYKHIFALDASSSPPYELLTRTFALAIAPVSNPSVERIEEQRKQLSVPRKALFMQSLLAADVLASLAPGYESGVSKSWLESNNALARHLPKIIKHLCLKHDRAVPLRPAPRGRGQPPPQRPEPSEELYIGCLGVSLLRRLTEKARDPADPASAAPPSLDKQEVLTLLQMNGADWSQEGFMQQLHAYARMEL